MKGFEGRSHLWQNCSVKEQVASCKLQERKVMSEFKQQIFTQLALSRVRLFQSLLGMNGEQLERPIWEDWSARKLLVHIGRWDAFEAERLQALIDGRVDETHSVNTDEINATWAAQDADLTLDAALAIVQKERNGFLNVIATADDDLLRSTVKLSDDFEIFATQGINNSIEHDDDHANDIITWRKANEIKRWGHIGERSVVIAALRASRNAVLTAAQLAADLEVEDGWSADGLIAHLAGWDQFILDAIQSGTMAHGLADADAINARFVEQWGGESATNSFKQLRKQLIGVAESAELDKIVENPHESSRDLLVYEWLSGYVDHDMEHADELYGEWLRYSRQKK